MLISLLARITVVAPDRACVLVQFAVNVGACWMIAQIEIGGVQSWVPTPENQTNVTTMFKIIVSSCRLLSKVLEQNFQSFNMSERFRCILCWWAAAAGLHGSKFCKLVLFQSLHEVELCWQDYRNRNSSKRSNYNNKSGEGKCQVTLYLFDRLLQSSDLTRQLLR